MKQIIFKNIETAKTIIVDSSANTVNSSGREVFIQDAIVRDLLIQMLTTNEPLISYEDIGNIVRRQKSNSHMEDTPDSVIASKYVFKARAMLKAVMVEDLIITIRGFGYKTSDKWLPVTNKSADKNGKNAFLKEITSIIEDCIAYSETADITQDQCGLSFIKPEVELIVDNLRRMNDCYYSFLKRYSEPGNSVELLELREKIAKVLLYTVYWRVGDSLTNDKFRSDYKNELQVLLRQINQAIKLFD